MHTKRTQLLQTQMPIVSYLLSNSSIWVSCSHTHTHTHTHIRVMQSKRGPWFLWPNWGPTLEDLWSRLDFTSNRGPCLCLISQQDQGPLCTHANPRTCMCVSSQMRTEKPRTLVHTRQCEDLHVCVFTNEDCKTEDVCALQVSTQITWRHLRRGPQSRQSTMGVVRPISHDLWNCDGLRHCVIGGGDNIIVQCAFLYLVWSCDLNLDSMTFIYGTDPYSVEI